MNSRRIALIVAVLVGIVAVAVVVWLLSRPEAPPERAQAPRAGARAGPDAAPGAAPRAASESGQRVTVTVEFGGRGKGSPEARSQRSAGAPEQPGQARGRGPGAGGPAGHGAGCPQTQVGAMLGIQIAQPHGCIVGGVHPGGLADRAGIEVGDSIVACSGVTVTCPSTLLPELERARAVGKAELTVVRQSEGKKAPGKGQPAGPAAGQGNVAGDRAGR